MERSKENWDAQGKWLAHRKEMERLEAEAGISVAVREAGNYTLCPSFSEAPEGTAQYKEEKERFDREYDESVNRTRDALLLHAYFSVQDVELRKRLICAHRQKNSLWSNTYRLNAIDARNDLNNAQKSGRYWPFYAAAIGVGIVLFGYYIAGEIGAICGIVLAYFEGRFIEAESKRITENRVEYSRHELEERAILQGKPRRPPVVFSEGRVQW